MTKSHRNAKNKSNKSGRAAGPGRTLNTLRIYEMINNKINIFIIYIFIKKKSILIVKLR